MAKLDRLKIAEFAKKKLRLRTYRKQLKEHCGDKAFLDPENLKYPVISPYNFKDCKYDCKLIHGAYVRAKQWHHENIAKKALEMMKKEKCEEKLKIDVKEI